MLKLMAVTAVMPCFKAPRAPKWMAPPPPPNTGICASSDTIRAPNESSPPNLFIHTSPDFSNFLLACSFLFFFFYKDINKVPPCRRSPIALHGCERNTWLTDCPCSQQHAAHFNYSCAGSLMTTVTQRLSLPLELPAPEQCKAPPPHTHTHTQDTITCWGINGLQLIHRLSLSLSSKLFERDCMCVFPRVCVYVQWVLSMYSMNPCVCVCEQRRGGVPYCSAVMYPSSRGVHCTPATSTLPSSSEKDRPRFRPWMVTSVPPSRGPATGLTYIGKKSKIRIRGSQIFNVQWFVSPQAFRCLL